MFALEAKESQPVTHSLWCLVRIVPCCVSAGRVRASMMTTMTQFPPEHPERRTLVSCLTGLYSCWWRRYEWSCIQPGDCCCSKVRHRPRPEGSLDTPDVKLCSNWLLFTFLPLHIVEKAQRDIRIKIHAHRNAATSLY